MSSGVDVRAVNTRRRVGSLLVVVTLALAAPPSGAVGGFADVDDGATAAGAVTWLVDQGITTGTAPGVFSPDDPVTRGQMATFLFRFAGEPEGPAPVFGDVAAGEFYSSAVGWLASEGITTGTAPGVFSPDDPVTRGQMATFLFRFAGEPEGPAPVFGDVAAGEFYSSAVGWLASEGITTGTAPGVFSPDDPVTRAQMALFLHRFAGEPLPGDPGANRTPVPIQPTVAGAFVEADGIVVIETTSLDVAEPWRRFPTEAAGDPIEPGATGGSFVQWGGANSFNDPTNGVVTIQVEITTPGRYGFRWHSAVGIGSNGTEHNDSFLRIEADSFSGERNGSVVCPREQLAGNRCDGDAPKGSSADGFFKVYRSGSTDGFSWSTRTSDNDAHDIYAEFDSARTYTIRIAGRSTGHAIDRIVLFRTGNPTANVSLADATDLDRSESTRR